jgi:ribosomal protein S24E
MEANHAGSIDALLLKRKKMVFVIVHLGPDPDKHVYSNIKYILKNFDNSLLVISNNKKVINFCRLNSVDMHIYERSSDTQLLFDAFQGDLVFRSGYWFLTIERIIAFV